MPPDVSVIVVSWNTKALLRNCLDSILYETGELAVEVIVVDNASDDQSADMVATEFPQVRLIRNAQNRGFAAANNQGIELAQGRYVLLLNSDAQVLDGAIAKSVEFADRHPEAAVVGCRTRLPDGRQQYNCYMFPSLLNLALSLSGLTVRWRRNRFFGRQRMTWWDYATPRVVDAVAGCFMLVRRQAIEEVGPMAECYFMYSEDTDWCWRFSRRGWKTMYTPDAEILHVGRGSSSQRGLDMRLLERRSLLMFMEKKSGRLARHAANVMFLVGSVARLFSLCLQRIGGGSGAQAAREKWPMTTAAFWFHVSGRLPEGARAACM